MEARDRSPESSSLAGPPVAGPSFPERFCGLVVFLAPLAASVFRSAGSSQWRDDVSAIRDLGLVSMGIGGGVTTALSQLASLLPLGPRAFRVAALSSLALAVAARLLYELALPMLRAAFTRDPEEALASKPGASPPAAPAQPGPWLLSGASAVAALLAALSTSWQTEGTVGGGGTIALAMLLGVVALAARSLEGGRELAAKPAAGAVALALCLFAESPTAAVAAMLAVVALGAARRASGTLSRRVRTFALGPPRRSLVTGIGLGVALAAVPLLFFVLRPMSGRSMLALGVDVSWRRLLPLVGSSDPAGVAAAWTRELGVLSVILAPLGAASLVVRPAPRWRAAGLLLLLALDALAPLGFVAMGAADPRAPLRCAAIAAVSVLATLGVVEGSVRLLRSAVPFARWAAALLVALELTMVPLTSEEAGAATDRSGRSGADGWTDLALSTLEPHSVVLVQDRALALRLWAARLDRGERPDVLVVPLDALGSGSIAARVLDAEPSLEPTIRSHALTGVPSEYALSRAADVRPLHLEVDPEWPKRTMSHLWIDGIWAQYAAQPVGRPDRESAARASAKRIQEVMTAAGRGASDVVTIDVLQRVAAGHVLLLATLGENKSIGALGLLAETRAPNEGGVSSDLGIVAVPRAGSTSEPAAPVRKDRALGPTPPQQKKKPRRSAGKRTNVTN